MYMRIVIISPSPPPLALHSYKPIYPVCKQKYTFYCNPLYGTVYYIGQGGSNFSVYG